MLISEIFKKIMFSNKTDRIGPDIPFTHWMLHYKSTMHRLCKSKFHSFGDNSDFRAGAYAIYCSNIILGNNVVIRPNTMLFADKFASITIEDDVMLGSGVHCYVNNHKFDSLSIPIIEQGYYPSDNILIKSGSWIGANVIILPGIVIGKNSVVGAGSVVTKSIPDGVVFAGVPAKLIKVIND
jgi:acetyltransferase-like isoleucine patch superfamily enzyme